MRAIELLRVSTPAQATDDRWGIARQQDANALGRQHHKLDIVRTAKVQESGKFILEDTDFQAIVRDLEAGLADGILVAEQSRLVRPESFDLFAVFGLFQKMRKMIWTPTAAIDPTTPEGAMLLGITGLMDGLELGKMKARMLGARDSLRNAGFAGSGGHAIPRGVIYTKLKGQRGGVWSYDPVYAPKVKEAFRLLIEEDASYERIAAHLDTCERTAQNTLQNPIWIGVRRRTEERRTGPVREVQRRRTPLKAGEKVRRYRVVRRLAEPEDHDTNLKSTPLITREWYERAQRIIAARRQRYAKKRPSKELIPGPMVRCVCGDGHYHKGDKRGYTRLYCASRHPARKHRGKANRSRPRPEPCPSHSFRQDAFYRAVEQMFAQALTAELLLKILGDLQRASKKAPSKMRSIDAELKTLDAALAKGLRQYMLGKVDEEIWDEIRDEIEMKRRTLLRDRPENVTVMYHAAVLAKKIAAVFAEYGNLLMTQKRELLHRAVKEITVNWNAEILSIKLSGGFLGSLEGWAKSGKRSRRHRSLQEVREESLP